MGSWPRFWYCFSQYPPGQYPSGKKNVQHTDEQKIMQWVNFWLTGQPQRVVINAVTSDWWPVTSRVSRGYILGPVLFINIILSCLDTWLKGTLSKFADDIKLAGAVDSLKSREALQRDFDKLNRWAITNHIKFNKSKCQILYLVWCNPGYIYIDRYRYMDIYIHYIYIIYIYIKYRCVIIYIYTYLSIYLSRCIYIYIYLCLAI